MKIAFVITLMDGLGGAQVHVRDLSLWLKARGHEPVILTGAVGCVSDDLKAQGVEVIHVPDIVRPIRPVRDLRAIWALRRKLLEIRPDVVSCHSSKAGLVGRVAARLAGLPVIFTAHGWAFTPGVATIPRYIYMAAEWCCGPLSDHIICVSGRGRRQALAAHIAPPGKITTVHNGMPNIVVAPRQPHTPPRIGMIARFADPKDHKTLIAALATIRDLPWNLRLVGGGNCDAERRQAAELNIIDRIVFAGERSDTANVLQEMDIFVLLSRHEGFPRSILEAMRSGLPVVGTNVGGIPESVVDGETGLLVPFGDVAATAAALRTVIGDQEKRAQMGRAGRQRYLDHFTFEHMVDPTLAIYRTVSGLGDSK
jgi:glycosyltransferase involved in cell wall biosynthesis